MKISNKIMVYNLDDTISESVKDKYRSIYFRNI